MLYFGLQSALQEIKNDQAPIFQASAGDTVFSGQITVGFVLKALIEHKRVTTETKQIQI